MRFARDPARGLLDPVAGLPKLLDEPTQLLAILLDVLSQPREHCGIGPPAARLCSRWAISTQRSRR
jgi:hypothetical protein